MAEFKCTVEITTKRVLKIFARDTQQATEKAVTMVEEWPDVTNVECLDCEEA